jgi:hypothetical protein
MDDRYFITVIREKDGSLNAISRRDPGPDSEPFTGPWRLLTEDEADRLAGAYNKDPREGGRAEAIEVFRFDGDPDWPDDGCSI